MTPSPRYAGIMQIDELRSLILRHARPDGSTPVEGVMIARHDASVHEFATSGTVMALIAQGEKRIALGERVYRYGVGQYLVASIDLPITGQFIGVDGGFQ